MVVAAVKVVAEPVAVAAPPGLDFSQVCQAQTARI
jgi:hypothetical protein